MGRPEVPLEPNGSNIREFALRLRDLRRTADLTYAQLAERTRYSVSTLQEAAAGRSLPTLKVTLAFVAACGGSREAWHSYWVGLKRAMGGSMIAPQNAIVPPQWVGEHPSPKASAENSWYIESFSALLRLDVEPIEAVEQRTIVSSTDGLSEINTAISVPRHSDDHTSEHRLAVDLLHGGRLRLQLQPHESLFEHVIELPRRLGVGDRHSYSLRFKLPESQPLAPHYVHVPLRRSDSFELRVRFNTARLPRAIWRLSGVPTAVIYERSPGPDLLTPDQFGEVYAKFSELRQGFGYGICWME